MSDTKKFPAIGLLVVFGVGSATAAVSLTGFGWLMVKQGLTQEAAAGLLFILGTLYQSEWETMQFVRAGLVLLMGVLGGILGMLRAERKRR